MSDAVVVAMIGSASVVLVNLMTWWQSRGTRGKMQEIHVMVNGQRDATARTIEALTAELRRLKADPTAITPAPPASGAVTLDDHGTVRIGSPPLAMAPRAPAPGR